MYFDKANDYKRKGFNLVNLKAGYEAEYFDIYLWKKSL